MPVEGQFAPYDPAEIRQPEDEGGKISAVDGSLKLLDAEGNPLPAFDPRYAENFVGLMYLGALSSTFNWLGHTFVVRTLSTDDVLAVPLLIKRWEGTVGHARAYSTAMAALAVVSVDGQELPMPVGDGQGDLAWAHQRFGYAKANWFGYTIDKIYSEYLALENVVAEVIDAMEKASGPAESTPGSSDTSDGPNDEDS